MCLKGIEVAPQVFVHGLFYRKFKIDFLGWHQTLKIRKLYKYG